MTNPLPHNLLLQVVDALAVRVFWKDSDSRFLGCNQRFAEDAGIPDPQEFIGKSDYYFFHPEQASAFRDDDAEVLYSGKPKLGIIEQMTRGDDVSMWVETHKLPLCNDRGDVVGVIGMYQDITHRTQSGVRDDTAA